MKSTQVDALYSHTGFWYIVATPAIDNLTYVITIDTPSGSPMYTGIPFTDLFPDHSIAIKQLVDNGAEIKYHGEALLGMAASSKATTVGIIDETEVTGTLPNCHLVKTVKHTHFIYIPRGGNSARESPFEDFQINNNHYFCESYDLTHIYPSFVHKPYYHLTVDSAKKSLKPTEFADEGFIWNNGWKTAFKKLGIPHVCIDLLQGACITRNFVRYNFSITYIARRSSLNPGTRFQARGLNDKNAPGNEVEGELIFCKDNEFWTQKWRRGSIPIRWKTTMPTTFSTIKNSVEEDYFNGTADYFQKLSQRYEIEPTKDEIERMPLYDPSQPIVPVPIRCISLLKAKEETDESDIKDFYELALSRLHEENITNVFFTQFDLARKLKSDGSHESMQSLLSVINPFSENDGFTHGKYNEDGSLVILEHQKGIFRFNCADSLDRTNLATFYYAMKITAQWCIMENLGLNPKFKGVKSNVEITKPYEIMDNDIVGFLSVSFVDVGNIISRMYTNTNAIKVNCIRTFAPSLISSSNDTSISVKRRFANSINDPSRQRLIELWTEPPDYSWYHRLDQEHIYIVNCLDDNKVNEVQGAMSQFPRQILSPQETQFAMSARKLTICFPCPMIPHAIIILLYPSKQRLSKMTINGGMTLDTLQKVSEITLPAVEEETWCRYKFLQENHYGLPHSSCGYVRFMTLEFTVDLDLYKIGPMKFEGRSIFSTVPALRYNPNPAIHPIVPTTKSEEDRKIEFSKHFENYIHSEMNLYETMLIEKVRLSFGLSESYRSELAIKNGVSPWLVDPISQLQVATNSICAFCHKPFGNNPVTYYSQSLVYPGLIEATPFGKKQKDSIPICTDCKDRADCICRITTEFCKSYTVPEFFRPHFSVQESYKSTNQKIETYTNEATASFLYDDCSLLWTKNGELSLKKDEKRSFDLFIVQYAIITKVRIKATSNNFDVFDEDTSVKLDLDKNNTSHWDYIYTNQPITQRLRFSIVAHENLTLHRIRAFYVATQYPIENVLIGDPDMLNHMHFSQNTPTFDPITRTETAVFDEVQHFFSVQVEAVIEEGTKTPMSLCVALYLQDKLVYSLYILLPEVSNGKKLLYKFLTEGVAADTAQIFYLDRLTSIKPHIYRFGINNQ